MKRPLLLLALCASPLVSTVSAMAWAQEPDLVDGALLERVEVDLDALRRESNPDLSPDAPPPKVRLDRIVYASDGLRVDGYLLMPAGKIEQPLPCVIFNRGGNRNFGGLTDLEATWPSAIASAGYIVIMSNYRGNGQGSERYPPDRVCETCGKGVGGVGREEFGGSDVNDVLNLIPALENLPEADATRIGMYGWSRGGLMTYLALARTDRMAAAIVGAGLASTLDWLEERPGMEHTLSELIPGWSNEDTRRAALEARSPTLRPEELPATTPLLLLHGSADERVAPGHALKMTGALIAARLPVRLILFEGGDHALSDYSDEVDAHAIAWLDKYVRDGKGWPSLEPKER